MTRRRLCECTHRYEDHAKSGSRCLAQVDDPDKTASDFCRCQRYEARPSRRSVRP